MCPKAGAGSVTWVRMVVLRHLGTHMHLAPRLGQLHLALAFGKFFFLLRRALIVAMGATHAQHVMR